MEKYEFSQEKDWVVFIALGKLRKSWADLSDAHFEGYEHMKENRDFIIQSCDEVAAEINAQRVAVGLRDWDIVKEEN